MKMFLALFLVWFIASSPVFAADTTPCAIVHLCTVTKSAFTGGKWQSLYIKKLRAKQICANGGAPSEQLELEDNLGMSLLILRGTDEAKTPRLFAEIFASKLTDVLASVEVDLNAKRFALVYRLSSKDKAVLKVECSESD